jgi:hypothetical protein
MVYLIPTPFLFLYYFSKISLFLVESWENTMLIGKNLITVYKGQNPTKGNIACCPISMCTIQYTKFTTPKFRNLC